MDRIFTFLKLTFICTFMLIASNSTAQVTATNQGLLKVGPATPDPDFDKSKAIFCPASNTFTLTASATDSAGRVFATYEWYEVSSGGAANGIPGQTAVNLTVTDASPGYHTYRVYGIEDLGNSQTCKTDQYEDFTVYVLPPLTVTATVPDANVLTYCLDNLPGSTPASQAIVLTATTAFSGVQNSVAGLTNPLVTDFGFQYTWYKTDLKGVKIGGALPTNSTNTYTVNETEVGSFNYMVEVVYAVKPTCTPSYDAVVQKGSADAVFIITPKPGKPTITIN